MIRNDLRRVSFDQIAIGATVTAIAVLYCLSTDHLLRQPSPVQSAAVPAPVTLRPFVTVPSAPPPAVAEKAPVQFEDIFAAIGYHLDAVRRHGEVPRVFMTSLPPDLAEDVLPERRKAVFIKTALPLILHVNELIALDRQRIEALRDRSAGGALLSDEDVAWLDRTAEAYGMERTGADDFTELLRRADEIPPSLALAQAAEESGWGSSRFAQEGNALFGQRVWREGDGIVPLDRADGATHRVAAFDHLIDGVKSYARNLNSHAAYEAFRSLRLSQRQDGGAFDGLALAGTLSRYSERGPDYVRTIRAIIRANALESFDRTRLGDRLITAAAAMPDA